MDEPKEQIEKYLKYYKNHWSFRIARIVWPFYELAWKLQKLKKRRLFLIGQSHIDAAWVWRKQYTIEKVRRAFYNAIKNIERFPNFIFSASSPQYFEWVRLNSPDLFEQIRIAVKNGRWELVGGSWIEPDCNIPDGESFCRQRLIGQRYYKKMFNKISEIEWFLDSFGYSIGLPQILKQSGARYFWTSKIKWNKRYKFPFNYFYWVSPDGSKILSHNCEGGWGPAMFFKTNPDNYKLLKDNIKSIVNYNTAFSVIKEQLSEDYIQEIGIFYGKGDGGHGPWVKEIVEAESLNSLKRYKISTALEFFNALEKYADRLPQWGDELAIDIHRGTFTTHSYMKWCNRRAEQTINAAEKLLTLTLLNLSDSNLTEPRTYQNDLNIIKQLWRIILFNQFHDILSGTSIPGVYIETYKELELTLILLHHIISKYIKNTHREINNKDNAINNIEDIKITLYNPLSWDRVCFIEIPLSFTDNSLKSPIYNFIQKIESTIVKKKLFSFATSESPLKAIHELIPEYSISFKKHLYPTFGKCSSIWAGLDKGFNNNSTIANKYIIGNYNAETGNFGQEILLIPDVSIKSLSKLTFSVKENKMVDEIKENIKINSIKINSTDQFIQVKSSKLSVKISKDTGNIISLQNGKGTEYFIQEINKGSAKLRYFLDDHPKEPAWNIDPDYLTKELTQEAQLKKVEIIEHNKIRAVIRARELFKNSIIDKFFVIRENVPYIEIGIKFQWNNPKIMIKIEFCPSFIGEKIISDTAYAINSAKFCPIEPQDKVRVEKPCQKFIDLSINNDRLITNSKGNELEGNELEGNGLTIITYDKYGFSHLDKKIQLTLLRTPKFPAPTPVITEKTSEINREIPRAIPKIDKDLADKYPFIDIGTSFTRLAVLPHKGNWKNAVKSAHEFNTGIYYNITTDISSVIEYNNKNNTIADITQLNSDQITSITIEPANVMVSAIKFAEDLLEKEKKQNNNASVPLIIRVYEMYGIANSNVKIRIHTNKRIKSAFFTDICELYIPNSKAKKSEFISDNQKCLTFNRFQKNKLGEGWALNFEIQAFQLYTIRIDLE
ncbi:MAG: glycoside hydrolase family 38 N-terminal domain-containing protein [Candidatus Helarchaeales archaeon]